MKINRFSIITAITSNFIFISAIIIILFYLFLTEIINNQYQSLFIKHRIIASNIVTFLERGEEPSNIIIEANNIGLEYIASKDILMSHSKYRNVYRYDKNVVITTLVNKDSAYLYLKIGNKIFLFKDKRFVLRYYNIFILFMILMIIILSFYIFTLKKLLPIRQLIQNMKAFSKGDFNIKTHGLKGQDEISIVSQKFEESVKYVKQNIKARNIFTRNIMHELKTPITKGRIVVEMLQDKKQKDRLSHIFIRLGEIIDNFHMLGQVSSNTIKLDRQECSIKKLVDDACIIGMFDSKMVDTNIADGIIMADQYYFAIVLKNLIDNAIKYSTNHFARVIANKKSIKIISNGKKLKNNLDHYLQAFVKEDSNNKDSLGLGLYIVYYIIRQHNYKLVYEHFNHQNIFEVKLSS